MRNFLCFAFISILFVSTNAIAEESETVNLDRRNDSRYLKSAYSFRFKTQDSAKHKNYVDLVYEAGRMRINNHGGLKNRIADLGRMEKLEEASNVKQQDAIWTNKLLVPVEGHTYALEVNENSNKMVLVFRVSKVTNDKLQFEWRQVTTEQWPIDIRSRAAAGTSGMIGGAVNRPSKGYQKSGR